jgi:XTP/dITP diphosphohydrolase
LKLRFISKNPGKLAEAEAILSAGGIEVLPINLKIEELQTDDMEGLVRDKALKAHYQLGHPLFVEHTGLFFDAIGGFPAGLTDLFWERLGPDRICELFGQPGTNAVTARTIIGYCDGRRIHQFRGEVRGRVPSCPRGDTNFQWDVIFELEGTGLTFAEMGAAKNDLSMRRKALDLLLEHLRAAHRD